jgi:hypothetical protein
MADRDFCPAPILDSETANTVAKSPDGLVS